MPRQNLKSLIRHIHFFNKGRCSPDHNHQILTDDSISMKHLFAEQCAIHLFCSTVQETLLFAKMKTQPTMPT